MHKEGQGRDDGMRGKEKEGVHEKKEKLIKPVLQYYEINTLLKME